MNTYMLFSMLGSLSPRAAIGTGPTQRVFDLLTASAGFQTQQLQEIPLAAREQMQRVNPGAKSEVEADQLIYTWSMIIYTYVCFYDLYHTWNKYIVYVM